MPQNMKLQKNDLSGRSFAHCFWFHFCAVCLALYLAYVAYLSKSSLFVSTADTLCSLLWFGLIAAGLYGLLLFACQKLDIAPAAAQPAKPAGLWFVCLAISAVTLGSAFLKAYPGGVSYDAANQWWQAHSGEYNNWHPVFHTLLIQLCTLLIDRYPFVVLVQCAAFAVAFAYLTKTLHEIGVPAWLAVTVHIFVHLTPLVRNTLMFVWKDNAMCIAAVILCAQTIRMLASRGQWLHKWYNALLFGLVLAFATLVRHNAILFTLPLAVIVLCSFAGVRRMAAFALAVMATAMLLVKGPLYGSLDVVYPNNTAEEAVGLPMIILGNAMQQQPEALDEDARAFLLTLAEEESWRKVYRLNDYNSIKFTFARELIADRSPVEILGMAAATAFRAPRCAFEAVNGTTGLVWDITGENRGTVVVSNSGHIPEESIGNALLNGAGKWLCALLDAPVQMVPLRWLAQNIGVQQLLLLLAVLLTMYRKGPAVLALGFPTLIYNLATMLLLCGNDARFFQYTMAISLPSVLALFWLPGDKMLPNTSK